MIKGKRQVVCDRCLKAMDEDTESIVYLSWTSILWHNKVPTSGWQYHYQCATDLPDFIKTYGNVNISTVTI